MKKKYTVRLTQRERDILRRILSAGEGSESKLLRAKILLKTDEGWTDLAIHQALGVGTATVQRVRRRFVQKGLEGALNRRSNSHRHRRKLDDRAEACLIALARSPPPDGRERWSTRLLAEKLVDLGHVDVESISHEAVRQVLKKRI